MSITAIVPIKHFSERVPGKNMRLMNGKPLYFYILNTLSKVPEIISIVVNTDSKEISERLGKEFPDILVYMRPKHLCGNDVSTNSLINNTIRSLNINTDLILQTHVTNPLLTVETIRDAIRVGTSDTEHDSLFGVNKHYTRLYTSGAIPLNHDITNLIPTQNLEPIYEENSCLYLFPTNGFFNRGNRIGEKPLMYPISKMEAQDIDWEEDFELTEIMQRKSLNESKVVLVTGAAGGIGRGICQEFKKKGWKVVGTDIISAESKIYDDFVTGDISDFITQTNIQDILRGNFGRLDCLVNNAASQVCKTLMNTSDKEWNSVMSINLRSPCTLTRNLLPLLKSQKGSIVNISSVHAITTSSGVGAYGVSKAALAGLTRTLAVELAKDGIRVNGIMPGATDTQMLRAHLTDDELKIIASKHLLGRIGNVDDISRMVYVLADDQVSGFMTGQNIVVDGGATISLSTEL